MLLPLLVGQLYEKFKEINLSYVLAVMCTIESILCIIFAGILLSLPKQDSNPKIYDCSPFYIIQAVASLALLLSLLKPFPLSDITKTRTLLAVIFVDILIAIVVSVYLTVNSTVERIMSYSGCSANDSTSTNDNVTCYISTVQTQLGFSLAFLIVQGITLHLEVSLILDMWRSKESFTNYKEGNKKI